MKLTEQDIPDNLIGAGQGGYKSKEFESPGIIYVTDPSVSEHGEASAYSRQDFIDLCDDDEVKAKIVWGLCTWEHPETVLDQWDDDDEQALSEMKANAN